VRKTQAIKNTIKAFIPIELRPCVNLIIRKIYFFGFKFKCPVCQSKIKLFKPLGFDFPVIREKQIVGGGLRNAMCPVCRSSDRVRLLYLILRNNTEIFTKQTRLLHIAPEKPLEKIFQKHKNIIYLTADLVPENVMEQMDITNIQYPENNFDTIICNHVLEHIPDDLKAMKELYRILKSGGWAILQVPFSKILDKTFEDPSITSPIDRERIFGQKDHVRIYGKDYSDRLKQAGFIVKEYKWPKDHDLQNPNNILGLNEDEVVFYCRKV